MEERERGKVCQFGDEAIAVDCIDSKEAGYSILLRTIKCLHSSRIGFVRDGV